MKWNGPSDYRTVIDEDVDFGEFTLYEFGKFSYRLHATGVQVFVEDFPFDGTDINQIFHIFLGFFGISYACERIWELSESSFCPARSCSLSDPITRHNDLPITTDISHFSNFSTTRNPIPPVENRKRIEWNERPLGLTGSSAIFTDLRFPPVITAIFPSLLNKSVGRIG